MKNRVPWLMGAGHMCSDINQGAVPTLLPFFIIEYQLSYAAAAGLVAAASVASSVIQPLFGHLADRLSKSWLMPAGLLLAGYGVAFTGFAPSYWIAVGAVILSGIGIAAFHPEAARSIHRAGGEKQATAMSIFAVGGNIGFAVGPVLTTGALLLWGLKGTLVLTVPVTLMALILAHQRSVFATPAKSSPKSQAAAVPLPARDEWFPFIRLSGAVICRSIIFYGLNTFLPLYWVHVLSQSKAAGGTALSIMFGTGIVATLLGGRLADRYGHRKIVLAGFGALIPLLFVFVKVGNAHAALALLIPIGFALFASFSPMIVMGQRYLPSRVGLASGITLGVAVSVGGVVSPLFGRIADHQGIPAALTGLAIFSIVATLLAFTLPQPKPARKPQ